MFSLVAIVAFVLLGIIWNKTDWFNLGLKVGFFALAIWGLVDTQVLTLAI